MKKIILFLFIILFVTGCSIQRIDMNDKDIIVDTILSKDIKLYNRISKGYKYYLPKGVKILNYNEYNEKLFSNNNIYYLYVDIVSYYYKTDFNYSKNINSYYYRDLNKKGYIDIIKSSDDKYFISYMYNYAKMESIVSYEQINDTIKDMTYILSSIKYNNLIIDSFIGENILNYSEEKYKIEKPKENDQTFLDYVNTYDNYEDSNTNNIDNETIENKITDKIENTLKWGVLNGDIW